MKNLAVFFAMSCLFFLQLACTPAGRWGDRAFYSPAHRGYVISANAPDERPKAYSDIIVLVDPLEGRKLTCREDVQSFLGAHTRVRSDDVKRENIAIATSISLFPFTALAGAGLYVGMIGAGYTIAPAFLAVPDAQDSYREGLELFEKRRFGAARQKLEVALAGDSAVARGTTALFELGRVYEQLGDHELAQRSYAAFVRRSWARAEAEYMRAEAYLKSRDTEFQSCESQDEVEVIWP